MCGLLSLPSLPENTGVPSLTPHSPLSPLPPRAGKAAAGAFWWLGTGWYQLVTLMSLLNVFILTR